MRRSNPMRRPGEPHLQTQTSPPEKTSPILIVGGGTWGISSALNLARRQYTSIKVLDAHKIPSSISAGNDVNKIVEEGSLPSESDTEEEYVWNRMHEITTGYWKHDPVFKEFYHETGIIFSAVTDECFEHVKGYTTGHEDEYETLSTKEAFQATMPEGILKGDFPGWRGFWRKDGAGWAFARGALISAYEEAKRLGVEFVAGDLEGRVISLEYENGDDHAGKVIGARTADGKVHLADCTILAAGASGDMIFDFENQLRPTAWVCWSEVWVWGLLSNMMLQTLAHIKLTEEEFAVFKDLPVLFNAERGFFMEPTADTHELKFCDEHPGYVNLVRDKNAYHHGETHSAPFARQQIPVESERRMRRFLHETLGPQMADREFSFARICWDADTADRQFLITPHPRHSGLIIAGGGSGNGFMMMPCVGQLVADLFEGTIEKRLLKGLRWRPEQAKGRDWQSLQGRFGADGRIMDFHDVAEWTNGKGDVHREGGA